MLYFGDEGDPLDRVRPPRLPWRSGKGPQPDRSQLVRYAETGTGDVRVLLPGPGRRLRVGDYRVIFVETNEVIEIRAVGHRRGIYR